MRRLFLPLQLVVLSFLISGCGSDKTPPPATEAAKSQVITNSFRPDTKAVESGSMVGYDGKQMRKSVDKALNGMDAHNKDLEKATSDMGLQ